MSRFKDRLWRELVREHGADLAQIRRPAGKDSRREHRRLLAGSSLGVAGVGTVVALVLTAAGSAPAFAVTQNQDGTVSVVIRQVAAIRGANARLAALGLKAKFVQVAAGCAVPSPPGRTQDSIQQNLHAGSVTVARGSVNARFDLRKVPPGQTVVVGTWRVGRQVRIIPARIVRGAAPDCLPLPPAVIRAKLAQARSAGALRCVAAAQPSTGTTGNSGPPPTGNSGNSSGSDNSGNHSAGPGLSFVPAPAAGSGNSGPPPSTNGKNSGNSGNSGNPPSGGVRPSRGGVTVTCPAWSQMSAGKGAPAKSPALTKAAERANHTARTSRSTTR